MRLKYDDGGAGNSRKFMQRDNADERKKHGQHVGDAFHLSDFFIDNTNDRETQASTSSRDWKANEDLSRLVKIVTGTSGTSETCRNGDVSRIQHPDAKCVFVSPGWRRPGGQKRQRRSDRFQ